PLVPWLYFVISHYAPSIRSVVEATLVSNWRHNIIFYQLVTLFGGLFIVKTISDLQGGPRLFMTSLLGACVLVTAILLLPLNRADLREHDGKALHVTNTPHPAAALLASNGVAGDQFRVFFKGQGTHLPGYRTYQSFSLFNGNGFNALLNELYRKEMKSRPHWSRFGSPCRGQNIDALTNAGYAYFVCAVRTATVQPQAVGFIERARENGYVLFESRVARSYELLCLPDTPDSSSSSLDADCDALGEGEVIYRGDRISGQFNLNHSAELHLFENQALGWIARVDDDWVLPENTGDHSISLRLSAGSHRVTLYFIDVFLLLGLLLTPLFALIDRRFLQR
ncbi:hypothetical protein PQZ54_05720, partial [Luminiphilus sp.]|nr:hypothetical protein [Luminiphilus sp.]